MKVTYLDHSGFAVEYKDTVLIFDWYRGTFPGPDPAKTYYIFASHSHFDHFHKKIFEWGKDCQKIHYILSADITGPAQSDTIQYVTADHRYQIGDLEVRTLHSTDQGVAFLVYVGDKVIYHAGDLNWWHWEEESESYNEQMRKDYQREIEKIKDVPVDLAFLPLDPRQEAQYFWGLDYFMKHTHTKYAVPMHMWGHYEIYDRLMAEPAAGEYRDRIAHIKESGQVLLF